MFLFEMIQREQVLHQQITIQLVLFSLIDLLCPLDNISQDTMKQMRCVLDDGFPPELVQETLCKISHQFNNSVYDWLYGLLLELTERTVDKLGHGIDDKKRPYSKIVGVDEFSVAFFEGLNGKYGLEFISVSIEVCFFMYIDLMEKLKESFNQTTLD